MPAPKKFVVRLFFIMCSYSTKKHKCNFFVAISTLCKTMQLVISRHSIINKFESKSKKMFYSSDLLRALFQLPTYNNFRFFREKKHFLAFTFVVSDFIKAF